MIQQLLFAFTFLFGVLSLLTNTILFRNRIDGFFDTFSWYKLSSFLKYLDILIFTSSLLYQINYWLYK